MKELTIFWLVLLLLALNCEAAGPVQLSGIGGQTILAQIASTNISNQVTKASASDLWSWGDIPLNSELNKSGMLHELPLTPDDTSADDSVWLTTKSAELGLNMTEYT